MPAGWADAEYRQAAMEAHLSNWFAFQVRVNREERGWTQAELARRMGTKQAAISKLEDPDELDARVSTLVKAAHAFDCALLIRLIPYEGLARLTADLRPDRMYATSYGSGDDERSPAVSRITEENRAG